MASNLNKLIKEVNCLFTYSGDSKTLINGSLKGFIKCPAYPSSQNFSGARQSGGLTGKKILILNGNRCTSNFRMV